MSRRITGQLQDPAGNPQGGVLRVVAKDKKAALQLPGGYVEITVPGTGNYDFTLEDGRYDVQFNPFQRFISVGQVVVVSGPDLTINELLNL